MNPGEVVISEENVVPWMDMEEFKKAYHDLYSDNICEQRRGLEQVSVWRTRYGSLPKAVEATGCIISALMHHIIFNTTESSLTEIDIQLLYGGAIMRFVYLMLEKDKPATSKISLSDRAVELNIPTWIIELRNDAVHSRMPSLGLFRLGANFASNYLKETYWAEAVATQRQLIYSEDRLRRDILNLIREYKDLRFKSIIELLTEEEKELLNQNLNAVLEKIHFYIDRCRKMSLEILVEPGNFTSFDDLDLLLNSKGMTYLKQPRLIIPLNLQKFWFPLLRELHNMGLLCEFLEQLLLAQGKTKCKTCHKLTIAWCIEIFEGANSKSILARLFRKKGVLLDQILLAYCCTLRPNRYSKELLMKIIAKSRNTKKKVVEQFRNVVDMFLGLSMDQKDLERESASILQLVFPKKDVENYKQKCSILNPINKEEEMDKLEPSVVDDDSEGNFIIGENVDPK